MIMIIIIKMWMNEYEAPGFDMLEPGVLGVFCFILYSLCTGENTIIVQSLLDTIQHQVDSERPVNILTSHCNY